MVGRIPQSDIDEIKSRTNIAEVVGEYVALKTAGVGSQRGLCPFHDERTPSFYVRPQVGFYHCFGCGESGDAISFLRKMDHVTFAEAVERLASRTGYQITYEEVTGGRGRDEDAGVNRARLLAANSAAVEYFRAQLQTPEADPARRFLGGRGFDPSAAEQFSVGFAPQSWDALGKALTAQGFSQDELVQAGLVVQNDRGGVYDRFRGRVIWPIRDVVGQTVGFGARRLFDDDKGPKYLNTPETAVFHKSRVLYGLDLAKREVSKQNRVVVVEGYTDVMACHLAGVTTAVATSGTAFGSDHIALIRRVMGDESQRGEVVFTFDPDAAGQKAAMRAFAEEKRFSAQTYVAVAPDGLDPCDLRLARGDDAVRSLLDHKEPMFEFMIRQVLGRYDLETVEGRVSGLRDAAPIIAEIRDPALRPGYTRVLARSLGMDLPEVQAAIKRAGSRGAHVPPEELGPDEVAARPASLRDLPNDPATRLERDALMAVIQHPDVVGYELAARALLSHFAHPSLQTIRDSLAASLGTFATTGWFGRVLENTPAPFQPLLQQLAVAPLPERTMTEVQAYARGILGSVIDRDLLRQIQETLGRLQRTNPQDREEYRAVQTRLVELEAERRKLRDE